MTPINIMKKVITIALVSLLATATFALAQETPSPTVKPSGEKSPAVAPQHQGPRGPMFRGEFNGPQQRGPRGPMWQRGPQQRGPVVSPNDKEQEWETTLGARRDAYRHQLNPRGPYAKGPMMGQGFGGPRGPMFRGGFDRPQKGGCCQCSCHKQQRGPRGHGHGR
jgi:hypothetical protein